MRGQPAVVRAGAHHAVALGDAPRGGEGEGDGQLGGRLGEHAGRVAHRQAEARGGRHVDVVVADGVLAVDERAGGGEGAEQSPPTSLGELSDGGVAVLAEGRPDLGLAEDVVALRDLDAAVRGGEELQPAVAGQLLGDHHAACAAGVHDPPVSLVSRAPP